MVFKAFGGDKQDRTADLLNAIVLLRWTQKTQFPKNEK